MLPPLKWVKWISMAFIFFVFNGCTCTGTGDNKVKDTSKIREASIPTISGTGNCTMSAHLPVLWLETKDLLALFDPDTTKQRLIFRFYVDDRCDITLRGWRPPINGSLPVVDLKTSVLSGVEITTGNYLGNLILTKKMFKNIKEEVDQNGYQYIKFHPVIDSRSTSVGQVTYRYVLTDIQPRLRSSIPADSVGYLKDMTFFSLTDTTLLAGDFLNPSPPRKDSDQ